MTFTDDDLKRLKRLIEDKPMWPLELKSPKLLIALLDRLEAAEKYVEEYAEPTNQDYQAWRKAAGK